MTEYSNDKKKVNELADKLQNIYGEVLNKQVRVGVQGSSHFLYGKDKFYVIFVTFHEGM